MVGLTEFLYCHNPLSDEMGEFVFFLGEPNCLIKILSLDEDEPVADETFYSEMFSHEFPDESVVEYQLVIMNGNKEEGAMAGMETEMAEIIDKAWQYWVAILNADAVEDDMSFEFN